MFPKGAMYKPLTLKRQQVRILTYNTQMIPPFVAQTSDLYPTSGQEDRLEDIVKSLSDYDIVCLQEVWGGMYSDARCKLLAMAMKAGFIYQAQDDAPAYESSYVLDGGLVIISRFPIVATSQQPFEYS
mmetsp:Transcript_16780/g.25853  ORF Transcript_16780/g.25853 Transcript_16780/m.25853 type:complete len:128 (+) Transcript_16780:52-435(+)